MTSRPKTVWVLGSGFSQALGGPLLKDLLSKSAQEDTKEIFNGLPDRTAVYSLYNTHIKTRWEHAEQFLEFVDLATSPESAKHNILRTMLTSLGLTQTPERMRDLATLSIAAEVSTYTRGVDLRAEAWAPYVRWARGRKGNDSVITFNYDTVLECLGEAKDPSVPHLAKGTVFHPFDNADNEFGRKECVIYKLHGSADWAWNDTSKGSMERENIDHFTLNDGYRPLIAMPGATKKRLCDSHLEPIWDAAMGALRKAGVVVFLGYRFPPSDSFARTSLVAALQQNT
jgi:hypothetical protein